jgi:hypothetical protein
MRSGTGALESYFHDDNLELLRRVSLVGIALYLLVSLLDFIPISL